MEIGSKEIFTALVSLTGGGFLGNYLRALYERGNVAHLHKKEFMEVRYKCIILLMYGYLDFEKEQGKLRKSGRNFNSIEELRDELLTEWNNMILFASDEALRATKEFITNPNNSNFQKSALAMRKDLWGGKLSAKLDIFEDMGK